MSDFPPIENPSKLKVAELKEELDKRGLPVGGLKKDLVARLEESQGLTQPPVPESANYHPDAALPETKGDDEDHAKPADTMLDLAVPPHEISNTNGPAVSEDIISSEVAAKRHPDQAAPPPPPPLHLDSESTKEGEGTVTVDENDGKEVGVGDVMVEGSDVDVDVDAEEQASIQPAALDSEVAKVVAEDEIKDSNPTPPPEAEGASNSMEKHISESRVHTPDLDQDEDVLDLGEEVESKKRKGEEISNAPKRPKRQFRSLPSELSHLIHPPTTCLYISNLRRPLVLSALHEHLTPSNQQSPLLPPPKGPFASSEYPNIWLSGIKSHAYAVYDTVENAIEVAKKIDGKVFPEDTGGALKVDFVDEDEITRLVQREEQAWAGGRQKLELKITKVDDEESGFRFDLIGGTNSNGNGSGNGRPGLGPGGRSQPPPPPAGRRAPVAVPLTGINALPVGNRGTNGPAGPGGGGGGRFQGSTGPSGPLGPGSRDGQAGPGGRSGGQGGGRGLPPHLDQRGGFRGNEFRPGPGGFSGGNGARAGDDRGGGSGFRSADERRTRVKPELSWREGPRAR